MSGFIQSDPETVHKERCDAATDGRYFLVWPYSTTTDDAGNEVFYTLSWELVEDTTDGRSSILAEGTLKWDGCIDCRMSVHFCDQKDIQGLADDLKKLYDHGDMMPTWSIDNCAD